MSDKNTNDLIFKVSVVIVIIKGVPLVERGKPSAKSESMN